METTPLTEPSPLVTGLEPLPDLCHKCGRCCKTATTATLHHNLVERAHSGEKEALDFLRIFEPYPSIEAARAVVPEQVEKVLAEAAQQDGLDPEQMTFYHCRYVTPEGICGIYDQRPRCCREAPAHGWSLMPPGCGFEGWQFLKREEQKAHVRGLKSMVHTLEALSPDGVTHPADPQRTLEEIRQKIQPHLKAFDRFGSQHW
ncbi:MAG: YkgJ family cysteine cluster protein [Vampirovibrionales bacterium]